MPELTVQGVPQGSCEIADSRAARRRGLLGRSSLSGSFLLEPCRSVHTLGMKFAIDVAHIRRETAEEIGEDFTSDARRVAYRVLSVRMMFPNRLGAIRIRANAVLEAPAGWLVAHGVQPGSLIVISR
jgi:uncharacterized protein